MSIKTIIPRIIFTQINHPTVKEEKKHQINKMKQRNKLWHRYKV
jgi:hypothetical protein